MEKVIWLSGVPYQGRVLWAASQRMAGQQGRLPGNSRFKLAELREVKAPGWQARFQSVCVCNDALRKDSESQEAGAVLKGVVW